MRERKGARDVVWERGRGGEGERGREEERDRWRERGGEGAGKK